MYTLHVTYYTGLEIFNFSYNRLIDDVNLCNLDIYSNDGIFSVFSINLQLYDIINLLFGQLFLTTSTILDFVVPVIYLGTYFFGDADQFRIKNTYLYSRKI